MTAPRAGVPVMFGAPFPAGDLLPWSWAEQRLTVAVKYWVTTVDAGRPHSRPVWAVWLSDGLWFSTGGLAGHHLGGNPEVSVTVQNPGDNVIVEGSATRVSDPAELAPMCAAYGPKYEHPIHPAGGGISDGQGADGPAFVVRPRVVFGWDDALTRPTRWRFDEPARR